MSVLIIGEIMMRFTPKTKDAFNFESLEMYVGGAEYNVARYLAQFNQCVKFTSVIPKSNLGNRVIKDMKENGLPIKWLKYSDQRLGTYYIFEGNQHKSAVVEYDRNYSGFAGATKSDFDLEELFFGVKLVHLSGITAALSLKMQELLEAMINYAVAKGIKVSYDSNFRAKLWTKAEAGHFLSRILDRVDYAFMGVLDIKYLLNMPVDETDVLGAYQQLVQKYPNLAVIASTTRIIDNPIQHRIAGNLFINGQLFTTRTYEIDVIDRVGGGDAYCAGILEQILEQKAPQEIVDFATVNALLKHYVKGDGYFTSVEKINEFLGQESGAIIR
ncbi:MAG: sugar kinase [Culicoidibacterales bacterium]